MNKEFWTHWCNNTIWWCFTSQEHLESNFFLHTSSFKYKTPGRTIVEHTSHLSTTEGKRIVDRTSEWKSNAGIKRFHFIHKAFPNDDPWMIGETPSYTNPRIFLESQSLKHIIQNENWFGFEWTLITLLCGKIFFHLHQKIEKWQSGALYPQVNS